MHTIANLDNGLAFTYALAKYANVRLGCNTQAMTHVLYILYYDLFIIYQKVLFMVHCYKSMDYKGYLV